MTITEKKEFVLREVAERGLSAYELSKYVNVSDQALHKIFSGKTKTVRASTVLKLYEFLKPGKVDSFNIKQIRDNLKLTQEEFGSLVGVSRHCVLNWEKGSVIPKRKLEFIKTLLSKNASDEQSDVQEEFVACPPASEKELMQQIRHLKSQNERFRQYAALDDKRALLYIRKGLCDVLMRFIAAGYDTVELFRNAVLAFYPQIDVSFMMVWEFQCFKYPMMASVDDFDHLEKIERVFELLTQKPAWL